VKSGSSDADKIDMFEWKNSYSIQIPEIDAQHQNLFRIAAQLHAAMTSGQGKAVTEQILDRLVSYTKVHFASEERLMADYNYPDAAAHKQEHDSLNGEVMRFQADFKSGRRTMTVQLLQFLRDWLQSHIAMSDTKLAPYIRGQAVA